MKGCLVTLVVLLFFSQTVEGATQEEIDGYPEYAEILEREGYNWETHICKTQDGWYLMMVRIRSKIEHKESSALPLLVVHGGFDSAYGHISQKNSWAL